jgi:hypothetical protein
VTEQAEPLPAGQQSPAQPTNESQGPQAKDGAYMAGDRRVHHTERSRWRHTFRRLAADALAALAVSDPAPAQQAVAKIVDLACDGPRSSD